MAAVKDWYGVDFYLERPLRRVSLDELAGAVAQRPGGIWLVHTDRLSRLVADTGLAADTVFPGPLLSAVRLAPAKPRSGGGR
jgi:hypothetical protein